MMRNRQNTLLTALCVALVGIVALSGCQKEEQPFSLYKSLKKLSTSERAQYVPTPSSYSATGTTPATWLNNQNATKADNEEVDVNSSAACACTYMLRFHKYPVSVNGPSIYTTSQFTCKTEDGAYPAGIKEYAEKMGFKVTWYTGTMDDLKNLVSKGTPVIVMLLFDGKEVCYIPVVGYTDNRFLLVDSNTLHRNAAGYQQYNETISFSNFDKMWNIDAKDCSRIFILIEKY